MTSNILSKLKIKKKPIKKQEVEIDLVPIKKSDVEINTKIVDKTDINFDRDSFIKNISSLVKPPLPIAKEQHLEKTIKKKPLLKLYKKNLV